MTENNVLNYESAKVRVIYSLCGSAADCRRSSLRIVAACVSAKMSCNPKAPEHCPVELGESNLLLCSCLQHPDMLLYVY